MEMIRKRAYLDALKSAVAFIVPQLNIFVTLLIYVLTGNRLTPEKVNTNN